MKHIVWIISLLLSAAALAQPVERIYVSTDRSVYIAGDEIWCSLFSVTPSGDLSSYSAVAYLELVSADGPAARAKVSLMDGRGAGQFRIPAGTPTGPYRLVAYTSQNTNEEGSGYLSGARQISVYNTSSTSRVREGVKVVEQLPSGVEPFNGNGLVQFSMRGKQGTGESLTLQLKNTAASASVSLSVYHRDALPEPRNASLQDFLAGVKAEGEVRFTGNRPAEYEGEIIRAHLTGKVEMNAVSTLSSAGSPTDVYVGRMEEDGTVLFYTNNIYGNRELVCDAGSPEAVVTLEDPFISPEAGPMEPVLLSREMFSPLVSRKGGLVSSRADTLVQFMPRRQDILLEGNSHKRYHLDDYRRFPSVKEVLVEIIPELRLKDSHGRKAIWMLKKDSNTKKQLLTDNIMVMLDGVVLGYLEPLINLDAMLLEDVDLYRDNFVLGGLAYNGLVNFVTKKNYVKAIEFPAQVRVVDFLGVSYPVAYLGEVPSGNSDYRQLLYWNPLLTLSSGEVVQVQLTAPAYAGNFLAVVEGLTEDGVPVYDTFAFEVR